MDYEFTSFFNYGNNNNNKNRRESMMGLGDCPKCWESNCLCGYKYKDYKHELMVSFITGLIEYRGMENMIPIMVTAINNWQKAKKEKDGD